VKVKRYGEGGWRWWCGFNASVLAQEGRQHDEALTENETETTSSSGLHMKEAQHDVVA
jgi:hypothetical protein